MHCWFGCSASPKLPISCKNGIFAILGHLWAWPLCAIFWISIFKISYYTFPLIKFIFPVLSILAFVAYYNWKCSIIVIACDREKIIYSKLYHMGGMCSHVIWSSNEEFELKTGTSWHFWGNWKRYLNKSFLRAGPIPTWL